MRDFSVGINDEFTAPSNNTAIPALGKVTIAGKVIVQVLISDNTGRRMLNKKCASTDFLTLSIEALEPGLYLFEIKYSTGKTEIRKLQVKPVI